MFALLGPEVASIYPQAPREPDRGITDVMNENDLTKLRELTLLLDLAYLNHFAGNPSNYKSAEGSIRLEFGNLWYRKANPQNPPAAPKIEAVVIYSSIFSAARVSYFDSLDDAINTVQTWYDHAKERQQEG